MLPVLPLQLSQLLTLVQTAAIVATVVATQYYFRKQIQSLTEQTKLLAEQTSKFATGMESEALQELDDRVLTRSELLFNHPEFGSSSEIRSKDILSAVGRGTLGSSRPTSHLVRGEKSPCSPLRSNFSGSRPYEPTCPSLARTHLLSPAVRNPCPTGIPARADSSSTRDIRSGESADALQACGRIR